MTLGGAVVVVVEGAALCPLASLPHQLRAGAGAGVVEGAPSPVEGGAVEGAAGRLCPSPLPRVGAAQLRASRERGRAHGVERGAGVEAAQLRGAGRRRPGC